MNLNVLVFFMCCGYGGLVVGEMWCCGCDLSGDCIIVLRLLVLARLCWLCVNVG